ncbi:MAG TPA: hypothetical protein VGO09_07850 [Flavisolibacter sp.]|jgi:hypothetical protein|nr:hypothetical protein [Flavisolibacter sp.]
MLQQVSAILLFFSLLVQSFSRSVVLINFYAHKEYIAQNLCENRDKPMMKCCGKCFLKKKLTSDKNSQQTNDGKQLNNPDLFCSQFFINNVLQFPAVTISFVNPDIGTPVDITYPFHHPPSAWDIR